MHPYIPRIGLTGGIGSGKSTVAQLLVARGAYLIDADAIARAVTRPGGAAIAPIAQTFGADYIQADGALNRDRMRQQVFNVPEAKQQLEAIIHPLVAQEGQRQARLGIASGACALLYDIPLLVESRRWRSQLDAVWVVDCSVETQIQRVMARNQLPREAIEKIIAAQATRAQRLAASDLVIVNENISLTALQSLVENLPLGLGSPRN
jgi:dephospho-CoA kinase